MGSEPSTKSTFLPGAEIVEGSRQVFERRLPVRLGIVNEMLGGGGRKFGAQQNVVAANLTTNGVASWTFGEFKRALTEGVSRDGRKLNPPMVDFAQFYKTMTDEDINAMFAYMKTLKPVDM